MAIYRCELRMIGRGTGRSSVNASAYRTGKTLYDERTGTMHDHGRKDRIDHSEIMLPPGAPAWAANSSRLWNSLEANERRCDAQLAREATVSIPHELPYAAGLALVRRFATEQFVAEGYAVEASVHGHKSACDGSRNWHAHIMATERTLGARGWGRVKDRRRNRYAQIYAWREAWADCANTALYEIGSDVRIDPRRAEDQAKQGLRSVSARLTTVDVDHLPWSTARGLWRAGGRDR